MIMQPYKEQERALRYKYMHIWASKDELRVKSTDSSTLEAIIRAINKAYQDIEIKQHRDMTDRFHGISIKGLDDDENEPYFSLAWWMFRVLCDRGWEPMATGENWYKLKYRET